MSLRSIPCLFMRGGTSRGPYFCASSLPNDKQERDRVLLALMGSPDPRQIDGLGGADVLTSKVAIVSPSKRPGVDVDYLFAQVGIDTATVDTSPPCGNMLAGVGPFAIETGLVRPAHGETRVRVFDENTQSRVECVVQTPRGRVNYSDGDSIIAGVPGSGAPILLNFLDVSGSKTGKLLPTGKRRDRIQGYDVSCVDAAIPMLLMRATDFGLSGHESRDEINSVRGLIDQIEPVRLEAAWAMGLGDATGKVVPKVALLAAPRHGGHIASRYFTPWKVHAAHAVTGGICVAVGMSIKGTIANELGDGRPCSAGGVAIEHPSGKLDIALDIQDKGTAINVLSAGVVRTARLLMRGEVMVPDLPRPASSGAPEGSMLADALESAH